MLLFLFIEANVDVLTASSLPRRLFRGARFSSRPTKEKALWGGIKNEIP